MRQEARLPASNAYFVLSLSLSVVDGGLQIRSLDQNKLSKWWMENLQTEFAYKANTPKRICKFYA
jgi:hypothetical protein